MTPAAGQKKKVAQPGVIVIDTREQLPLEFGAEWRTVRGYLPVGDYSLAGFHTPINAGIIIERKSKNDFVNSFIHHREQEMAKIQKMKAFRFRAYVIEATRGEIERGEYESETKPQSLLQTIFAVQVRHNVHFAFEGTPDGCARQIESWFRQFARGIEKDYKALHKSVDDFTNTVASDAGDAANG